MTFNEVMALIMPSFIALFFYSKVINRKLTVLDGFFHLVLFMMMTNIICYTILIYLQKTITFVFSPTFTLKYSLMATIIAVVITTIYRFLELNLNINLRVVAKNEED
jgi:hypothetical protein